KPVAKKRTPRRLGGCTDSGDRRIDRSGRPPGIEIGNANVGPRALGAESEEPARHRRRWRISFWGSPADHRSRVGALEKEPHRADGGPAGRRRHGSIAYRPGE